MNAEALELESGETFQFEAGGVRPSRKPRRTTRPWNGTLTPATGVIDQNGVFTAGNDIGFASEGVRVDFKRGNFTANYVVPVSVVYGPSRYPVDHA